MINLIAVKKYNERFLFAFSNTENQKKIQCSIKKNERLNINLIKALLH